MYFFFFFFKQKTAYEMRISDWSSDVCSSDLALSRAGRGIRLARLILQRQRGSEHIAEHRVGQSPGIRVVARAMIAIDEMAPVGQHMDGPMREGMNREARACRSQRRIMPDPPESNDNPDRKSVG